jgi:hypothetical protein
MAHTSHIHPLILTNSPAQHEDETDDESPPKWDSLLLITDGVSLSRMRCHLGTLSFPVQIFSFLYLKIIFVFLLFKRTKILPI